MARHCIKPNCSRVTTKGELCFYHRPRKAIPQMSDKEKEYQDWKENVARPYLIRRYGNKCACCGRPANFGEKLDIDHIEGKGSTPSMKSNLKNLQLLCRYPCHDNKTNEKLCIHGEGLQR